MPEGPAEDRAESRAEGRSESAAIEAVLTVATEPVPPGLLAELLEVPVERVEQLCRGLAASYEADGRGFVLTRVAGGYRFQSSEAYVAYVERFVLDGGPQKLSPAALETLAVVAYKQPISRSQVSAIRGVNVESVMRMLVARGYVQAVGRDDGPGQAILFGTTPDVLGASRPRLDRGPASARGIRPAGFDRGDARERAALRAGGVSDTEGERLQKVLARVGYGSRRTCEELIAEGRVTVNGRGRRSRSARRRRKRPRGSGQSTRGSPAGAGVLPAQQACGSRDDRGRPTRAPQRARARAAGTRVFSVGRLDRQTEGLLVLTNDGTLAQLLAHPRFGVEKEYLAQLRGVPGPGALRSLRQGVLLDDGETTAPARVAAVSPGVIRIVIHEGRNRQVRRMCEAVGHPVVRLVRTRIGPITDRSLRPGAWRPLGASEVRSLAEAALRSPSKR